MIPIKKFANIVKGDVAGDGISSVSDVEKLYQYLKVKIEVEDYYLFAELYRKIRNLINCFCLKLKTE